MVLVSYGNDYFVERTAFQSREILERRLKSNRKIEEKVVLN